MFVCCGFGLIWRIVLALEWKGVLWNGMVYVRDVARE